MKLRNWFVVEVVVAALAAAACGGSSTEAPEKAGESGLKPRKGDGGDTSAQQPGEQDSGTVNGVGPGESVCQAGRQVSCPCPGNPDGAQRCKDDGSGYEACACEPGGGNNGGAGGTAGSAAGGAGGMSVPSGGAGGMMGAGGIAGGGAGGMEPAPVYEDDPCPIGTTNVDCSDSCGGWRGCVPLECSARVDPYRVGGVSDSRAPFVMRTPALSGSRDCDLCEKDPVGAPEDFEKAAFVLTLETEIDGDTLFEVDPPWFLMRDFGSSSYPPTCGMRYQCLVFPSGVRVATMDPNAPARNVRVRPVSDNEDPCAGRP